MPAPTDTPIPPISVLDPTDGIFDGVSGHFPHGQFAVSFIIENESWLTAVEYHIAGNQAPFQARIYNSDLEVVAETLAEPNLMEAGWYRVKFPGDVRLSQGTYFAGIYYLSDSAPLVSRSSSSAQGRTIVIDPDGTVTLWSEKAPLFGQEDGEFGIRILIQC